MTQQRQVASGTYDPVARTYVEKYLHEVAGKPDAGQSRLCEVLERDPYPDVEYQGHRVDLLARKPDTA